MSEIFCTSRTSFAPRLTSKSGLQWVDLTSLGLKTGNGKTNPPPPAIACQFFPLMSWMIAEPVQESSVGNHDANPFARARRHHHHKYSSVSVWTQRKLLNSKI